MFRHLALVGIAVVTLVASVVAAPGIVRTKNGQLFVGDVIESGDRVTINMGGIDSAIDRGDIVSIEYGTFEQLYEQKLASLPENDAKGRIALARDAFSAKRYLLSARALELALQIDPDNAEAVSMLNVVRSQLKLERDRVPVPPSTNPSGASGGTVAPKLEKVVISNEQVNLVRIAELKPDENVPVRIEIDVKRQMADKLSMTMPQFNRLSAREQLARIVEKGDASMLQGVQVQRDPASLLEFRQKIQPLVLQGCATATCHGGALAGPFILYSPANDDATTYTNFLILQSYKKKVAGETNAGIFGGEVMAKMIDRSSADRSLLVQYALPASIANDDHPPVRGYNGIVRDRNDARYRLLVDWIGKSLVRIEPKYGFDFVPPKPPTPTTQPSQ
jgi:hypothetical protein